MQVLLFPFKKAWCSSRSCMLKMFLSSASTPDVLLEKNKNIGVITLTRPKALNTLNLGMVESIYPTLKEWQHEVSCVIIKGVGEKAFCAGGDIRAITEAGKRRDPSALEFFQKEYKLNHLIGTLKVPYVAFIHGITMGGGVGVSVHGKYRVATEKTVIAMPETAIGLFPDVGGSFVLPRLPFNIGFFIGLTGYRLKGSDVLKAGFATHFCDYAKLPDLEKELQETKSGEEILSILDKYTKMNSLMTKEFTLMPHLDKITKHFSLRTIEEIINSLKKDESAWSQENAATLMKMSPTSLKVSLRLMQEGKEKPTLKECLKMEYRVVARALKGHDFYEGVRAVLIDKDNKPKWNPPTLDDVTSEHVDSFFAPLPDDEELKLP